MGRSSGWTCGAESGDTGPTMRHQRRTRATQLLLATILAIAGTIGTIGPLDAASGYSLNLYRSGDFVRQTNNVQCVGASMQMMINMIAPKNDRTASKQLQLQKLARYYSDILSPRPGRQGASVRGWAAGLNELGYGEYVVIGYPTIDDALSAAAQAMRATGRPVGLLVWRGRHAWVMSGFRATADPKAAGSFHVTHVNVLDPLYPAKQRDLGRQPRAEFPPQRCDARQDLREAALQCKLVRGRGHVAAHSWLGRGPPGGPVDRSLPPGAPQLSQSGMAVPYRPERCSSS